MIFLKENFFDFFSMRSIHSKCWVCSGFWENNSPKMTKNHQKIMIFSARRVARQHGTLSTTTIDNTHALNTMVSSQNDPNTKIDEKSGFEVVRTPFPTPSFPSKTARKSEKSRFWTEKCIFKCLVGFVS